MPITPHLGKLPAQPARPHLRAARFLDTRTLPDPPDAYDWLSMIKRWPMYGNDRYGDCVFAGIGHQARQIVNLGQQREVTFTDQQILDGYSQVTGFNPADPNTDNGTYVQDGMAWWRKTGLAGHQIVAYASIDPADTRLLKQCISLFGAIGIGFNFPTSAWSQFSSHQPWDYVPGAAIDGGHYVMVGAYDPNGYRCVTWGATQGMTQRFWSRYVDECWLVIDDEMVSQVTGKAFSGVDLHTLGADFAELTGEPNPIPAPPTPAPTLELATPADRALRSKRKSWWDNVHAMCAKGARRDLREWEAKKDWS